MRLIIPCAGGARRWGNYLDVPKHLAPLCGEPILHRHVRLANELADADVKVVVADMTDRRYLAPGSTRSRAKLTPDNGDVDKILSSAHLWDSKGMTVIAWGDVWWSRPALTDVVTADVDGWHAWLRFGPDGVGGELFAFAFTPDAHQQIVDACAVVVDAHRAGRMTETPGGWALYRALHGQPVDVHQPYGNHTIIDDWTDDLDVPGDWRHWCWRWAHASDTEREAQV